MDIIVGGMSIPGADGIFSWQKPDSPRARPAVFLAPMLFGLKKFISFWLMPLPFCLTLIVVGACLLRFSRRPALGRRLLLAGVLLLMLASNHFVSRALLRPLETRHAAIPELLGTSPAPALAACRYVVVLGGGNGHTPDLPATGELSPSALARITEGVRLLRVLPQARLLVSGPGDGQRRPHAVVLARAAMSLGIEEGRILMIDQALDTEDEARLVREKVGDAPIALVTSAWHMPRSVALFRHAGLAPVTAPADFAPPADDPVRWSHFFWDAKSLDDTTLAVRERIGYLWIWLRGKT